LKLVLRTKRGISNIEQGTLKERRAIGPRLVRTSPRIENRYLKVEGGMKNKDSTDATRSKERNLSETLRPH
jgi:hypothetical protein